MKFFLALVVFLFIVNASFGQEVKSTSEAWEGFSSPDILSSGFVHDLASLPLEANLLGGNKAWSGHYWPSKKAGINNRWFSPKDESFDYESPDKATVARMELDALKLLSPSEKYDLLMGRYDYPLKKEVYGVTSRLSKDWVGICHGWAPAAIHHNEPNPKYIQNSDGVVIPFGSADIKALLSYYYAYHAESAPVHQVGKRCFFGSWIGGARGCGEDLNAGAFHIILSNKLGIKREGFVADVERFNEVWNQPIVGFRSKILERNLPPSKKAARNAVSEVFVATEFFYTDESEPNWETVMGTRDQVVSKLDLFYRLELDTEGRIVGGAWESSIRPDFLWDKEKVPVFEGYLEKLSTLLNDN